jgi:acylphosphatase
MIVARRYLIGGQVQGVGFRMFAEARAAAEGVHGYVRNLPDGCVEALVEGDEESVDRIEMALRRGPTGARVESFTVEPVEPLRRATGFSTR